MYNAIDFSQRRVVSAGAYSLCKSIRHDPQDCCSALSVFCLLLSAFCSLPSARRARRPVCSRRRAAVGRMNRIRIRIRSHPIAPNRALHVPIGPPLPIGERASGGRVRACLFSTLARTTGSCRCAEQCQSVAHKHKHINTYGAFTLLPKVALF